MNKITRSIIINPPTTLKITKEGRVIMPLNVTFEPPRVPLSMVLMASSLEKYSHVRIIDAINEGLKLEQLENIFKEFSPQLTIINSSTPTFSDDIKILDLAKRQGSLTVMYGQHVDALPREVMHEHLKLDFIFLNDSEIVARNFIFTYNTSKKFENVKGLVYRNEKNEIIINEKNCNTPLDEFPKPALNLINKHLYKLPNGDIYTVILTSRGCNFNCPFCPSSIYHGYEVRYRSVNSIIKEIIYTQKTYNINVFLFQSDLFTSNKNWVISLCNEIISNKLKIKWICNTRADTINTEMLTIMKKAGCFLMSLGIESGSPKMLKTLGKNPDIDVIKNIVRFSNRIGIKINGSFVIGYPGETNQTLAETKKLIFELPLHFVVLMTAYPFPGTLFFDNLKKATSLYKFNNNWENIFEYPSIFSPEITEIEIVQFINKTLKKYYISFHYFKLIVRDFKNPLEMLRILIYALFRFPGMIR